MQSNRDFQGCVVRIAATFAAVIDEPATCRRRLQGPWIPAWLNELAMVPVSRHDDQADASPGAFCQLALNANTVTTVKLTGFRSDDTADVHVFLEVNRC